MTKKQGDFQTFLKNNGLQLAFWVVTVVVALANLWVASKLSPLAKDLTVITTRVDAHEDQQRIDVSDLKDQIKILDTKIDQLLLRK